MLRPKSANDRIRDALAQIRSNMPSDDKDKERIKAEFERSKREYEMRKQLEEGYEQQKALFYRKLTFKVGDRVLIIPDAAALQGIVSPLCWYAGKSSTVFRTEINEYTGISIGIALEENGKQLSSYYPWDELILMDENMELLYGKR